MNEKPLVSVIIPVYNIEDYLLQCLDSLVCQTLDNIEIILIDDGSTDDSGRICDQYTKKDLRFKVFHKSHEGLAAARNDGIALAQADFIMYVDGDDWAEPTFCEEPYQIAKENDADIVCFQYMRFDSTHEIKKPPFPVEGVVKKEEVLTRYWKYTTSSSMNKIYRKELFKDIEYPIGHYSEDIAVAYKLFYQSQKIIFLNRYLYHYRTDRPNSICNSGLLQHRKDYWQFTFKMIEDIKTWGMECREEENKLAMFYLLRIGRRGEMSDRCDAILRENRGEYLSRKQQLMFRIYKISPAIFDVISIISGKR